MTRKLPVDAGWTIVRREGQGISSVPGAKWLIKPGEIQLGAFNTYRTRRVGSMRTGATRRVADDTLRFLEVQATLVIARTYRDLSVTRRTFEGKRSGLSRSGPFDKQTSWCCVIACGMYETRVQNSANRTEIRTDTESKASFDKRTSKNDEIMTGRGAIDPRFEWIVLLYAGLFSEEIFCTISTSCGHVTSPGNAHGLKLKFNVSAMCRYCAVKIVLETRMVETYKRM